MHFKDDNWKEIQPQATTLRVYDDTCQGLFCQVSPKGVASWVLRATFNGQQKSYTLGRCKSASLGKAGITPSDARKIADDIKVNGPEEFLKSKMKGKQTPVLMPALMPKVQTFAEVADDFMERYPHKSADEKRNKANNIKKLKKAFEDLSFNAVTDKMIIKYLDSIIEDGHFWAANSVQRTVSKLYNWGHKRIDGICPNPVYLHPFFPTKKRQERLYEEDMVKLSIAFQESQHPHKWGVPFVLLCGGRIGVLEQIEHGRWDATKRRLEFQEGVDGVKGLQFAYLCTEAIKCWEKLPRISPALLREAWEEIRDAANFGRRVIRHDLRRTFKSFGSDWGEGHIQLEILMGHSLGVIADTYHVQDWKVLQGVSDRVGKRIWKLLTDKNLEAKGSPEALVLPLKTSKPNPLKDAVKVTEEILTKD